MQEPDATPAVVYADCKLLHLEIVMLHSQDAQTDAQRELQAVLRLYQQLRAERIRRSH